MNILTKGLAKHGNLIITKGLGWISTRVLSGVHYKLYHEKKKREFKLPIYLRLLFQQFSLIGIRKAKLYLFLYEIFAQKIIRFKYELKILAVKKIKFEHRFKIYGIKKIKFIKIHNFSGIRETRFVYLFNSIYRTRLKYDKNIIGVRSIHLADLIFKINSKKKMKLRQDLMLKGRYNLNNTLYLTGIFDHID